jgi:hypothetical protein
LTVFDAAHRRVGSGIAEVAVPDHIELAAHAYLIMGLDDEALVDEARVLEAASDLPRPLLQRRARLHGNSVLAVNAPTGMTPSRGPRSCSRTASGCR